MVNSHLDFKSTLRDDLDMRSPFKLLALFLTSALAMGVAGQALAADIGECGTPEAMTAKMRAEGQRSIASAQRVQQENGVGSYKGVIFTSNADQSVGYILQADKPVGERANQVCISNRMQGIRFSDARNPNTPESVFLKGSDDEALKKCNDLAKDGKIVRGSCMPLNQAIKNINSLGVRVMFQAFNVKKQADGSYKPDGTLTTVMGNVTGVLGDNPKSLTGGVGGSILYSSLPDGATIANASLLYPKYTEYGLLALEQQLAGFKGN